MRYLILLLLLLSPPVLAWNAAGHRLVAALAWGEMNDTARARVTALLTAHPDHAHWLKRQGEGRDESYGVFLEASTWADEIRRDPRFHDADEPPTTLLPGFPDMERHGDWHFRDQDLPRGHRGTPGEIDSRLILLAGELKNGDEAARVYALPWLLHLVADIHQPLHCGGRNDGGGNGFMLENPYNPRKPFMSLHAYWDDLPGPTWLRGKRLGERLALLVAYPGVRPIQGSPTQWLQESRVLVEARAYPSTDGSLLPIITPEFHQQSRLLAEARLAAAGARLGYWLNQLLGGGRRR